jgi:hypothetical protein
MALSRKTYVATAVILAELRDRVKDYPSTDSRWGAEMALNDVARELGDYFESDNDQFDPPRFWTAAKVDEDIAEGWR